MARQTAAEREHEAELAARRKRYAAAKRESAMDYNEEATVSHAAKAKAKDTAEQAWCSPQDGPPAHAVVEIETGGDIVQGRKVGGVWKMVGPDGKLIPQAVHVSRWRFIGKKVV